LERANSNLDVVITKHAGHANDLILNDNDLRQSYDGIVIVSGDGLVSEVTLSCFDISWFAICEEIFSFEGLEWHHATGGLGRMP